MTGSLDKTALIMTAGGGAVIGGALGLGGILPCGWIPCCAMALLVGVVVGTGYSYLAKQNDGLPSSGMSLLGGALVGFITGVGFAVGNGIVSVLGFGIMTSAYFLEEVSPEMAAYLAAGTGLELAWTLAVSCIAIVMIAAAGAVGGLTYGAISAERPSSSAQPE